MRKFDSNQKVFRTSILLASVALMALSGAALADSYYFRSRSSAAGAVEENQAKTAILTPGAANYRAAGTISGQLSSSLSNPVWMFSQSPASPSLDLVASGSGFSGIAPAVSSPTEFQISATASSGPKTASASPTSITVHPLLTVSGGPSGTITGTAEQSFPTQPDFAINGLVGTASYDLVQTGQSANIATLCPGLSFSSVSGKISGTPTNACSVTGLNVRVQDGFDSATANSYAFSISIEPLEKTVTVSGSQANLVLSSLFSPADWQSSSPKRVVLSSGAVVYSDTPTSPALSSGTARNGNLTLQINSGAEVQGAGGIGGTNAAGGVGGDAILIQQSGLVIQNSGAIRAGGGGGGAGGKGGNGQTAANREPTSGYYNSLSAPMYGCYRKGGGTSIYWAGSLLYSAGGVNSTYTINNYTYYCGTNRILDYSGYGIFEIYRTSLPTQTEGGAGGRGGNGLGHNQAQTSGATGASGGTGAGTGGSGGAGGNWGVSGTVGSAGKSGVWAGSAGFAGGLAGYAINGSATYSGSGVKQGR